jgi:hypothetical protein
MGPDDETETYNPWSIVHLVFEHLSEQGLHPTLGDGGSPGVHAEGLLRALSIAPAAEGNREVVRAVRAHLEEIRTVMLDGSAGGGPPISG